MNPAPLPARTVRASRSAPALLALTACLGVLAGCHHKRHPQDPAVTTGDAALLEISPYDGEPGVATRREVILRFSAPIRPDTATAAALRVVDGDAVVPTRVHVNPTRDTVTLFPVNGWPSARELTVRIDDGKLLADSGRPVDADRDGRVGGSRGVPFRVVDLTRVPDTEVCGRVFASDPGLGGADVPLADVVVTVDGLELECNAVTDALGNFCLQDAPAGDVFVHVRGSTASAAPAGFHYPDVGKAWHTLAGQRVTVGTIFLPAISDAALQPVSPTAPTPVRIVEDQLARVADPALREQLRATEIVVPADSLFADDGTRGGKVGIGPVARDRLPGQLPTGLNLPIVITIQTDGPTNFDRPVPVRFPNLPDPITGASLPAGAKSALWSFNHDTGRFEVVGPMTVSADGRMVETDPGVGVRAPGWHGSASGTSGSGGPPGGGCEGADCCEPNCCKKTIWDLGADVAKVAGDLARCASELTRIGTLLGCLVDLTTTCFGVYDWALALGAAVTEGMTPAELVTLKNATRARIDGIVALIDSCELERVIGKVSDIKDCFARLVSRANSLCEAYAPCVDIWGKDAACALLARIDEAVTYTCYRRDVIESYLKNGIRTATLTALYGLLARVCELIGDPPGGGTDGGEPLTAAQAAELQALVAAVVAAFPPQSDGEAVIEYCSGGYVDAALVADQTAAFTEELNGRIGTEVRRVLAFALAAPLTDDVAVQRGTTTDQGTLQRMLPASAEYLLAMYDPIGRRYGLAYGVTAPNGVPTELRSPLLVPAAALPDGDGDQLADDAEFVYGTSPTLADSDGDGVSDGDEVHGGTDPLDGVGGRERLLADLPTVGPAIDLCADDGALVLACGAAGIEVFNAWQNMAPTSVARLDTPGAALRVACARLDVAVADGTAGLALVDLSTPAEPVLRHQVALGDVRAVAAANGIAVAGTQAGRVALVDLEQGSVLLERQLGTPIVDVQLDGELVYALADASLFVLRIQGGLLNQIAALPLGRSNHRRLVLAGERLVSVHWSGFVAIDVAAPTAPAVLAYTDTTQLGWRHLALDGSGNAVAVVGLNNNPDPTDDLRLYRLDDLSQPGAFVRDYDGPDFPDFQPGTLSAVVVYNGLAYTTDRRGRLFCARYRLRDLGAEPPTVSLTSSAVQNRIEEGRVLLLRAATADDVQVAHVDFELDGQRLVTDGSYPFELRLVAPPRSQSPAITLGAKCWDTGGNLTIAAAVVLEVTEDVTPPSVVRSQPAAGGFALAGQPAEVLVVVDEQLAPASIGVGSLLLSGAGPDGDFGTADDEPVVITSAAWRPDLQAAFWTAATPLSAQRYRAVLSGPTDVAGNALPAQQWEFTAITGLRASWFTDVSSGALTSFFAGRTPLSVVEYRAGTPPQTVTSTVVPNVDFPNAYGAVALHAGADGVWQSASWQNPTGDDIAWAVPDVVGLLLEGTIDVPAAGDVQFLVTIDDSFVLEIGGQIVFQRLGCQPATTFTSPLVTLPAGRLSFRLAAADNCGAHFACILRANGAGFPNGVLPPSVFGSGN